MAWNGLKFLIFNRIAIVLFFLRKSINNTGVYDSISESAYNTASIRKDILASKLSGFIISYKLNATIMNTAFATLTTALKRNYF